MAKQFFTNGTGSQQTLTPSQNEKVAIYDTIAEAEADLANLEAGQIVATPDTGDELAQPVDTVTSGNMHSVTSGAVYSELFKLLIGENNDPDNFPIDAMRAYKVRDYNIGWVNNDGIILTIPWSENFVFQIAVDDQSNFMAVRSKGGSSWNAWQQIPLGFGIKNIWTEEKTKYGNTSGANITWTCIEFQNGLKACFGNTTSVRTSAPIGNVYYSGGTDDSWYFPTNLFTSKPTCFMNISGESVWMWAGIQDKGSKDVTPLVCPHSSIAFTNQTIRFNILAFGV